ncbi:MAG: 50S ribosomal protein L32 [Candidatus Moranbacteria bacterium]|nr:50S ribosomal protein L32 [Candidatus Moranbacteria bacterium]
MAVPKQRQNKSRRDRRRGGQERLKKVNVVYCGNCSMPVLPHRVCSHCGFYAGKQAMVPKVKKSKSSK